MRIAADLQAYCESRFAVGEPTSHSRSVTNEPYVVIGHEYCPLIPGVIREGQDRDDFEFTEEEALQSAKASFDVYAADKPSTSMLYWRWPPELKQNGKRWSVYMRCLISAYGKRQDAA